MIFFQRDVFLPFQLFLLFDLSIWCWTTIFLNSSGGQKILLAIRLKYGEEIGDKAMCVLQDGNLIPCWDSVWHSSITYSELRWVQRTAASSVWEQENEVYLCLQRQQWNTARLSLHMVHCTIWSTDT